MRWCCFWAAVGRVYRGPASSSITACSQLCLFKLACLYLFSHVTLPPAAQTWWQYVSKIVVSRMLDGCHIAIAELMEMCQSTDSALWILLYPVTYTLYEGEVHKCTVTVLKGSVRVCALEYDKN